VAVIPLPKIIVIRDMFDDDYLRVSRKFLRKVVIRPVGKIPPPLDHTLETRARYF
jgi:hypothetical protein